MDADKDASGRLSRVSPPLSLVNPPITSQPQPQPTLVPATKQRQMFTVELKPGETTVVSWKKLIKESGSGFGEALAPMENKTAVEAGPVAGVKSDGDDLKHTLQAPNCFSAVIEKIERLYMGNESSDEEELVAPDDEQYDTEDSFIDDTELDEYFQVDKLSTKHNGYFVNRGKLEWNESSSSPNLETKKRRRKDSEGQNEMNLEHVPKEHANRGNIKIKAAARNAPLVAKNFNQGKVVNSFGEHYQEGKLLKIKPIASPVIYKKQSNQFGINLDVPPSTGMLNKDASSAKLEPKDVGKVKSLSSKALYKASCINESLDTMYQTSQEKAVASQVEPQPKKLFNCENEMDQLPKIRHEDRCKTSEYLPMTSYPTPTDPLSHRVDNVTIRPKGTTLERAIQELEKIVALSRPPNPAVREVDSLVQGVKRRLPQEVKQKLAKVARLSASQGKISEEELIDRLMGFLGHLVQRKTLKRNMREMVELGLSAKQQKADKLQQIKKEVHQMIKLRVSILKSKGPDQQLEGSADDFQNAISTDERKALTGRYSIDVALEEKLCDLYDLYVEGMDEDKGPQSRKLYVEFAELWPPGYMDNLGIRDAIYRAKKRRQHKLQVRNKERIERKKLTATAKLEKPSPSTQPQADQERHLVPRPLQDKPIPNLSTASQNKLNDPSPYRSDGSGSKHHEKARGNSSDIISDGGSKMVSADMKKNMKRKSEIEGDCHAHPQKMLARPGKIKHNLHGPNNDSNPGLQPKPVVQMPASVASVQPC